MMPLQDVRPGDPLNIHYLAYNAAVDLARRKQGGSPSAGPVRDYRQTTRIKVQNQTGEDLDRFSIVALGDALIDQTENLEGFQDCFMLGATSVSSDNLYTWGILDEAIPDGEIGDCIISGLACVQINVTGTDQFYAVPNGTSYSLDLTDCGICRILYCPSDSGLQWAYVNIG